MRFLLDHANNSDICFKSPLEQRKNVKNAYPNNRDSSEREKLGSTCMLHFAKREGTLYKVMLSGPGACEVKRFNEATRYRHTI